MEAGREEFLLKFRLHVDGNPSVNHIADIASLARRICAEIAVAEAQALFDAVDLPLGLRGETLRRIRVQAIRRDWPTQVKTTGPGTWELVAAIPAGASGWILAATVGQSIKEAWAEGAAHERMKRFFRDQVFGGAASVVETTVARKPRQSSVKVRGGPADYTQGRGGAEDSSATHGVLIDLEVVESMDAPLDYGELIRELSAGSQEPSDT